MNLQEQDNDFRKAGEKCNDTILIRVTKTQKERLRVLAEGSGYKTISDYVRTNLLNPSIEKKLNSILEILQESKLNKVKGK